MKKAYVKPTIVFVDLRPEESIASFGSLPVHPEHPVHPVHPVKQEPKS